MADLTLRPNAAGSLTNIAHTSGTYHYADCGDNSDASYVYEVAPAAKQTDLYNVPDHTTESGSISQVEVFIRGRKVANGGNGYFRSVWSTNNGANTVEGTVRNPTSVTTYSQVYATNLIAGAAWTWANIDSLQIGAAIEDAADPVADEIDVYDVWAVVTYTPYTYVPHLMTLCGVGK